MTEHFNKLTPAEAERLAILAEECAEVIHAVAKVQRHGYESRGPHSGLTTNREDLERQMGDVRAAMVMLCDAGDVKKEQVHRRADFKLIAVQQYTHHQPTPRPPARPVCVFAGNAEMFRQWVLRQNPLSSRKFVYVAWDNDAWRGLRDVEYALGDGHHMHPLFKTRMRELKQVYGWRPWEDGEE